MSFKHRTYYRDTFCLNCGYPIVSNYCAECGQKAHLHKDSFWHMAVHFVSDYFHYDGKFWSTISTIFTKPGQITLDYIRGKRVKYVSPIPLYIFVTSLFFLLSHSFENEAEATHKEEADVQEHIPQDSSHLSSTEDNTSTISLSDLQFKEKSVAEYDSIQASLAPHLQEGLIQKYLHRKLLRISNTENMSQFVTHHFKKNLPKVLFILLPFFALLLKLIFYKNKRLYVDHLVFSIHTHTVAFILMSLLLLLGILFGSTAIWVLVAYILFGLYLFFSLRRVYPSGTGVLIFKQVLLTFSYLIGFLIALCLVALYTFISL